MKLLIIINIAAGFGDGSVYDYLRMVCEDGDEHALRCTDGTTDVTSLVQDAEDFDAVVVAGGDGTIAAVTYALANTGIPVLPFPSGTANLLANNLFSPYEPHALARMTREMETLDFDLGEIEADGKRFGFGIMAGAGYDATIMHDAQPSKKLLGPLAYFQAEALGVLLVNFSRIQFEIPVTHGNKPRDGAFEVVILKSENAFGLIPALIACIRDREGEFPDRTDSVEVHTGRNVSVYADPPLQIQYDGELPGLTTPFKARVLDGAARFIMSGAGYEFFTREK